MLCWYFVGLTSCYFWMELIAIFARANLGECKALWRLAQNFGEWYGINLGRVCLLAATNERESDGEFCR